LTLTFATAASANDRVSDRVEAQPSAAPTIIAVPNTAGYGVTIVPAHVTRLLTQAYDLARNTFVGDLHDVSGVAYASEKTVVATPPSQRELDFQMTPEIKTFLTYFTAGRGRGVAIRGVFRSEAYRADAQRIFREEGVPADLIWLAQVESAWQPKAVSPVGACGIWQFIPATGERFGMTCSGDDADERMDFEKSTRGAAKYLKWLNKRYDGNWPLAIGAYNCGEGGMDRAIDRAGSRDFWAIRRAGVLPTETANYVPSVIAASIFGTNISQFDLDNRDAVANKISARPTASKM